MKPSGYTKKAIWGGAVLTALAATGWTRRPQPIHVTTAMVMRGSLTATVSGEGRTRVRVLFVVAAPVDGQLERVVGKAGDTSGANDTVASIRPAAPRPLDARTRAEAGAAAASAKAAVARAEASEQEARVALEHAESQLETTRKARRERQRACRGAHAPWARSGDPPSDARGTRRGGGVSTR